jgi:reactive intermediate/imine deaminase
MSKQVVFTKQAPLPAGPYSQAIIANGFVFVAGQRPQDPKTGIIPETIQEQTSQCILNIKSILEASGSSLKNIVRSDVYLSDIGNFDAMNEIYRFLMPEPFPSRTTIGTQLRNILVEIEVIATI